MTYNFSESLGKHHPLLAHYYAAAFSTYHAPSLRTLLTQPTIAAKLIYKRRYWSLAVDPRTFIAQVQELAKQAGEQDDRPHAYRIPPLVHQIWLGSPFPEKYRTWADTWRQLMPGWRYTLWTDADIKKLNLENRTRYAAAQNFGERSDIARYEILYRYGGLYVDTDFECLHPEQLDSLHRTYQFYGALQPLDIQAVALANGCIAAVAGHPILRAMIDYLKITPRGTGPVWQETGPIPFTRVVADHISTLAGTGIILPPTSFFPLTFTGLEHPGTDTIAVHHWEASWK